MSHSTPEVAVAGLIVLVSCLAVAPAMAIDPPDSAVNPASGDITVVDSPLVGSRYDVRLTVNPGNEKEKVVYTISSNALDDLMPHLVIEPDGDTWVTWWRNDGAGRVLIRKQDFATKTWTAERLISEPDEDSRNPRLIYDGTKPWVVFEIGGQEVTSIALNSIVDEPDPIPRRTIVATTPYVGHLDARLHNESGALWVTWADSDTDLGWSAYDHDAEVWSAPAYMPYQPGEEGAALASIRDEVLGN